jgi:hypothetical protein
MPDAYVVDTDVLSYVLKRDTRVQPYLRYFTGTIVVIPRALRSWRFELRVKGKLRWRRASWC